MTDWITGLFADSVPPAVRYFVLFAAVILAILILLWIARKILGGTFVAGGRARHLRLAVMDATPVDSRRRLVLVRRDDVEHLILIGGPTDVVVEQNIKLPPSTASGRQQPPSAFEGTSVPAGQAQQPEPAPLAAAKPAETEPVQPQQRIATAPQAAAPRPVAPPPIRPAPPIPPRPAPVSMPQSLAQRPVQPSPAPVRPAPAYLPPTAGPAAGIGLAAAEPKSHDKSELSPVPTPSSPPFVQPVVAQNLSAPKPEPVAPPVAPVVDRDPVLDTAGFAPIVSAVADSNKSTIPDPNDSLLMDLSDEIARAAGAESEAPEFSLEEEMESILADLDVKAERSS